MKMTVLTTAILMCLSGVALADTQTYTRYGDPVDYPMYNAQLQQQPVQQRYVELPNTYMTYPGREEYGQHYGRIPRHPGDYKDAVDRGSWGGGGDAAPRSFDIR